MILRVRDFAYLEGPRGETWGRPGEYMNVPDEAGMTAFLAKSGQAHKVTSAPAVPKGASVALTPAEFANVRIIGENRSMAATAVVKRKPGRPRKVQPEAVVFGEDHED